MNCSQYFLATPRGAETLEPGYAKDIDVAKRSVEVEIIIAFKDRSRARLNTKEASHAFYERPSLGSGRMSPEYTTVDRTFRAAACPKCNLPCPPAAPTCDLDEKEGGPWFILLWNIGYGGRPSCCSSMLSGLVGIPSSPGSAL